MGPTEGRVDQGRAGMADPVAHDAVYNTVDRDDVASMIEVARYGARTRASDVRGGCRRRARGR